MLYGKKLQPPNFLFAQKFFQRALVMQLLFWYLILVQAGSIDFDRDSIPDGLMRSIFK